MNVEMEHYKVCDAPLLHAVIFLPVILKMLTFTGKYEAEYGNTEVRQRMSRNGDLTQGGITSTLLHSTLLMMAGSLLQQCYSIADTPIVGQCVGSGALVAVGSAYTLMAFLVSILLGLSISSGTVFSLHYGAGSRSTLRRSIFVSFVLIGTVTPLPNMVAFICPDPTLHLLQVPQNIYRIMCNYLRIISCGIVFMFIYNLYAAPLQAVGDSMTPLWFLAVSVVLNVILDLFFILQLGWGIEGAIAATVIAQGVAAVGILPYTGKKRPELQLHREGIHLDRCNSKEMVSFSILIYVQQSVMNFGILMIQGLVNSFGTTIMTVFAAAVKIDSLTYMPVQEFRSALSTFIAQNSGARCYDRIRRGVHSAFLATVIFSLIASMLMFALAEPLMLVFVRLEEVETLATSVEHLRIEDIFYYGIGILFPLYGYYCAIRMLRMSAVLTVISLGIRVVSSYVPASIPSIGVAGIQWPVPIGWLLADIVGMLYYKYYALCAA